MKSGEMENLESQNVTLSILYALSSWALIALTIAASIQLPLWFYPLTVFIIGSRQLALGSLAHEGLHGNLAAKPQVNDFLARYFCAFPLFISLNRYRQMHLLHHRFLGTKSDPDLPLFDFYPLRPVGLVRTFLVPWFTGKTVLIYAAYFSDVPNFLKARLSAGSKPNFQIQDDRWQLLFFWLLLIGFFISANLFLPLLLYWLIPLTLQMLLFRFAGGLQHGIVFSNPDPHKQSRNIVGRGFFMELLLPCSINYHAEHHRNPRVPFFKLNKLFKQNNQGAESYWGAVKSLAGKETGS